MIYILFLLSADKRKDFNKSKDFTLVRYYDCLLDMHIMQMMTSILKLLYKANVIIETKYFMCELYRILE